MKKLSIFLLFLCLLGIKEVYSATITDQITSTFLGDYHYVYSDGKFGDFELFRKNSNQDIAYCIEPGVSRHKGDYTGYYGLSNAELALKAGISTQQLEMISLLSYYGYGYKNHTSTDWVVATQSKIWSILGKNFQFTSKNYSPNPWQYVINTPSNIQEKYNELDALIERHYTKPSFDRQTILIPYGESYILEDTNGILNEFEIKSSTNCTVTIENNSLIITPNNSKSEGVIYLIKKNDAWNREIILFHHDTGQDLLATGDVKSVESTIVFKAVTGKITLKKVDKGTKTCTPQGEASLEGAEYGLYKEDGTLVQSIKLENCEATISNLVLGNYYVKELKAPPGYQLDENKYPFSITKENFQKTQTILVEDEVFTTDLVINKHYLTSEGLLPEENTEFAILNKKTEKVLYTFNTNELGQIHVTLPYGEYIIRQISGLENYYKSEDIFLNVNETTPKETAIDLINEPYTSKVKVIKKDSTTNEKIYLENISFKIYDVINKKYVCQTEDCVFKTNQNGEFITEELFPSTYRIEEIKQNIKGYLWNDETILFTVDKNSPDIIELEFFNKPAKGKIKLQKTNQKDEPLSNVVFTLYAKEDILENGKIIYNKDEAIKTFLTNDLGQFETNLLPLGEYYFLESNSLDGYIPLKDPIFVSLKFRDSFTEVVEYELSVVNKPNYKGKIVLTKTDNLGNPLENVGFTLYAKEDIFENGIVIYYQNERIGDFYTNSLGQLETSLLPLGKYYFIESNPLVGYISTNAPILAELKYNDEEDFIVIEQIEIINEIFEVPSTHLDATHFPAIHVYLEEDSNEKKNKHFSFAARTL